MPDTYLLAPEHPTPQPERHTPSRQSPPSDGHLDDHGAGAAPAWSSMPLARGSVSAAQASLSRLVGRGLLVRLPALGLTMHVDFDHAPADAGVGADAAGAAMPTSAPAALLEGQHGAVHLDNAAPLLHALTGYDLAALGAMPAQHRVWSEAALLGRLAVTPLGAMWQVKPAAAAPADAVRLRLRLDDGEHVVSSAACATAATWCALLVNTAWQRVRLPVSALEQLQLSIPLGIARHSLPLLALQRIAVGDVILPGMPEINVDGQGWLMLGGRLAQVHYGTAGTVEIITLEDSLAPNNEFNEGSDALDPPMDGEAQATPHGDDAADVEAGLYADAGDDAQSGAGAADHAGAGHAGATALDHTPMLLSFELGRLALTLGQLRTLAPGAVLQLAHGGAAHIAVLCAGKALGQGEAVDVEGRLGIRITHWNAA